MDTRPESELFYSMLTCFLTRARALDLILLNPGLRFQCK